MREVTQAEFYAALKANPADIMPSIVGRYPYTSDWRYVDSRELWGKSVATIPPGKALLVTTYYLV